MENNVSEQTSRATRGRRLARTILVECSVLVLFVLLTIAMTWPLAANLDRAVSDPGDPLLNAWIMEWTWHAMTTPGAEFWHAPIFHPLRYTIAFSENLLGVSVFFLPLYAAGVEPLVVYNLAFLAGFAFSGYAAHVLGRLLTGSRIAGLVAGIFFAFMPFRFDHLPHLQHIWSAWIPLALAALVWFARRPSWGRAVALGAAMIVNGLSNGHWLLFGGVAIGLAAIALALLCGRALDRRYWLPLLVTLAVSHGILFTVLYPYRIAGELYGMKRGAGESATYSAEFSDWLVGSHYNRFYGGNFGTGRAERSLFPGTMVLVLASLSLLMLRRGELGATDACEAAIERGIPDERRRRTILKVLDIVVLLSFVATCVAFAERGGSGVTVEAWRTASLPAMILLLASLSRLWIAFPEAWGTGEGASLSSRFRNSPLGPELQVCILWTIVGVVGSLGMNAFFHQFLFTQLEPFRSLRVPARWSMIAYVGLAGLAAAGLVALLRRVSPRRHALVVLGIVALLLFELRAAPIRWHFLDTKTPPVYEWLASAPVSGATLELPVESGGIEYFYLFRQISHHKPIINGISGFASKLHVKLEAAMKLPEVPTALFDDLEKARCSLLVVHNDSFATDPRLRAWLREGVATGRLAFVRRFDHGAGGDWVFALTSVETNLAVLRAPEVADRAGRTPSENARIFLEENGRTYSAETIVWLDTPKAGFEVKGELVVSGWALSPYGVTDVRLVFGNGSVTLPAERYPWPGLHELMPWYPENDRPGFRAKIPERPNGLRLDTDLRVEVVDGRGQVTEVEHRFFRWHPRKQIAYRKWKEEHLPALFRALKIDEDSAKLIRAGDITILVDIVLEENQGTTDEAFVKGAYQALLGRPAEDEAVGYYRMRLQNGAQRRDVVEAIIVSKEFKKRMVVE